VHAKRGKALTRCAEKEKSHERKQGLAPLKASNYHHQAARKWNLSQSSNPKSLVAIILAILAQSSITIVAEFKEIETSARRTCDNEEDLAMDGLRKLCDEVSRR
jgi:hypothetical protein